MAKAKCKRPGASLERTPEKQAMFGSLLESHLYFCMAVFKKRKSEGPYFYYDMTSASGYTEDLISGKRFKGSPLIFLEYGLRFSGRMKFLSVFFERDLYQANMLKQNVDELKRRILEKEHPGWRDRVKGFISAGKDSSDDIARFEPSVDGSMGLIYIDPNGYYPYERIRLGGNFSHIDIFVNMPCTGHKRALSVKPDGRPGPIDGLKALKNYWWVLGPVGAWQWVFLYGSNYDAGIRAMKKFEFIPLNSKAGREVYWRCNFTKNRRGLYAINGGKNDQDCAG